MWWLRRLLRLKRSPRREIYATNETAVGIFSSREASKGLDCQRATSFGVSGDALDRAKHADVLIAPTPQSAIIQSHDRRFAQEEAVVSATPEYGGRADGAHTWLSSPK